MSSSPESRDLQKSAKTSDQPKSAKKIASGFDMSDSQASQAPTLPANSQSLTDRPRNAKGHKSTCTCILCKRIQKRIDEGLEPHEVLKAKRAAKRALNKFAAKSQSIPVTRREKRIAKHAAVAAAVVAQAASGLAPDDNLALKIAGFNDGKAGVKEGASEGARTSIITMLDRAGITDERLVSKANELLEAQHTKFFAYKGEVIDERDVADNKIRHNTWRDLMMVRGHLHTDEAPAVGGLMIINAVQSVNPGHDINCPCAECISKWEDAAARTLSAQSAREAVKMIEQAPELVLAEDDQ